MSLSPTEIDSITKEPVVIQTANAAEAVDLGALRSFEEAQLDGEPDLIVELIDLYIDETARLLGVMRAGLNNKDWEVIKRASHSLRGSSGNLGILQMSLICDQMEHMEFNDLFPTAEELLHSLDHEFARVCEVLLQERKRRTP
jgi:HPt (histidine-containing phosphotransfer) domain-containing protein